MANRDQKVITDFFQIFTKSLVNTLSQTLDEDICSKIEFTIDSSSETSNVENLKENNIIYKIDYATGTRQGSLAALMPEELIFCVSDILTGGEGDKPYKGTLSELDINSASNLLSKIFKALESTFKTNYSEDLAFGAKPLFLLKDMPEYVINTENVSFDFLVSTTLQLNEKIKFKIPLLLNISALSGLMRDLGLSSTNSPAKKSISSSIKVDHLTDVKINITAELGRARVPMKYALELVRGSLIELDSLNGSDIKVFANDVEFAHAQVVAVEDNFGLKITKIISPEERLDAI